MAFGTFGHLLTSMKGLERSKSYRTANLLSFCLSHFATDVRLYQCNTVRREGPLLERSVPQAGLAADAAALWETYGPRLYRYLLSLTGRAAIAEDLLQDTFVQALRDMARFPEPPRSEAAWLFRIATNRARDHFRRRQWVPLPLGLAKADPSDHVAERELMRQALRRLPPETAAMLLLRDVEGFTPLEIAEMVGQNYEAVRKRLARARVALREEYLRLTGGEAP